MNTTDILIVDVPFEKINMERSGTGLSVSDRDNPTRSCFTIARWTLGLRYRDILFTSLDHVVLMFLLAKRKRKQGANHA